MLCQRLLIEGDVRLSNGSNFEIILVGNHEPVADFFADIDKQRVILKTSFDTIIGIDLVEKRQIWRREEGLGKLDTVLFVQNLAEHESSEFLYAYEGFLSQGKILQA